jgi:cation diffusion facilitator CzcD-associated flavoprotein CzcO
MFQSSGKSLTWSSTANIWEVEITETPVGQPASEQKTFRLTADYAILNSGGFTYPKLPNVPGLTTFKGEMMHTARWNYAMTGGSPASPILDKLKDKRVAIIGTGATAIQAVPELAKYAKQLFVVQRTPSAVGFRGNADTDLVEWKTKIANKPGWQLERQDIIQRMTEEKVDVPEEYVIHDGFAAMPSIAGAWGGPSLLKPEEMPKHLEHLHKMDDLWTEEVRKRAGEIVKDPETAKVSLTQEQ